MSEPYPTTMTNWSMPAWCAAVMTCSRIGLPSKLHQWFGKSGGYRPQARPVSGRENQALFYLFHLSPLPDWRIRGSAPLRHSWTGHARVQPHAPASTWISRVYGAFSANCRLRLSSIAELSSGTGNSKRESQRPVSDACCSLAEGPAMGQVCWILLATLRARLCVARRLLPKKRTFPPTRVSSTTLPSRVQS